MDEELVGQVGGAPAAVGAAPSEHWVDVGGPVHYVDFGGPADGPLVVCVHGLGAAHTTWWALGPLLAGRARVLAVDLAGFGRTPAAGRSTDVAANRQLLAGFLTAVAGGGPALLAGNSMGGMISVLQAAADPGSVAGLVLLSPALPIPRLRPPAASTLGIFTGMVLPKVGSVALARRRVRYSTEELVEQALRRTAADYGRIPPEAVAAMVALSAERSAAAAEDAALVAATRSVVRTLARPGPLTAAIAAVTAPTLLIHGRRDRLVPVAAARRAATRRPDWQLEVLDGCGHLPQLEAAERTAALIDSWLDGAGAPAESSARAARLTVPPPRPAG